MYNNSMDRKSRILLYIFFFLFAGTVMFSFARYLIFRDFEVVISEPAEEEALLDGESVTDVETVEGSEAENIDSPTE